MKYHSKLLLLPLILISTSCAIRAQSNNPDNYTTYSVPDPNQTPPPPQNGYGYQNPEGDVNFQVFYDNLAPYGHWVQHPRYGYIWIPDVAPGFQPYATAGHWVYTGYGWTWMSDYPWGWAAFHYGRWGFDDYSGWFWGPDNVWGPAWVSWRRAPGYYGWVPLAPGISVEYANSGAWVYPENRWTFVDERYIYHENVYAYYAPRTEVYGIYHRSNYIGRTYEDRDRHHTYMSGPDAEEVHRSTGREVRPMEIRESRSPGESVNHNELNLYRPEIKKEEKGRPAHTPAKVEKMENVRRDPSREKNEQRPMDREQEPQKERQQPQRSEPQKELPQQHERNEPQMEHPNNQGRQEPGMEQHNQQRPEPGMEHPQQPQKENPQMGHPDQQQRNQTQMEHTQQPQPQKQPTPSQQHKAAPRTQTKPQPKKEAPKQPEKK